jgi:hypothetical protein
VSSEFFGRLSILIPQPCLDPKNVYNAKTCLVFIMKIYYFTTCSMQLQCLIWLKKWLKISLTISDQPNYSWN